MTAHLRHHVLIVDDHPLVRDALSRLIQRAPEFHVCAEAASGPEAISLIEKHRPNLVLLDLMLKGVDGLRLIADLKALSPETHVLVVSQHDEATHGLRAWYAGADGFVNKEAASDSILSAMNTTVHGGKFFSPRLLDKIHMEETKTRTHYKNTGDKIDTLSSRQLEIFQLIGQGHSTREIAECLKLSVKTVEVHRENIKDKLGAETSSQLGHLAATWWAGQLKPGSPT